MGDRTTYAQQPKAQTERETRMSDHGKEEWKGGGESDEMVVVEEALGAASCYKITSKNIRFVYRVLYVCPGAMEERCENEILGSTGSL